MNAVSAPEAEAVTTVKSSSQQVTPQMKAVLDYLNEYGEISDEELQELLNVKRTRAYLLMRQMNETGLIEIMGRGITKRYRRA